MIAMTHAASPVKQATHKRLLTYIRPYRTLFVIGMLTSIPASALNGLIAWGAGPLIDNLTKHQNYGILLYIPPFIIAVCLIQGLFDYISEYYTNKAGYAVTQDIRKELFYHLTDMDVAYFRSNTTGNLMTRFYTDTMVLQQGIVTNLQSFLLQFCGLLCLAGVLFYRNWQFAFISIAIIGFMVIPIHFISQRIRKLDYRIREVSAGMINVFNELNTGIKEVKSFKLTQYLQKRFDRAMDDYMHTSMGSVKAASLLNPTLQLIAGVGIAIVLYLGAMQVIGGKMSLGDLTSFLLSLILLYRPVKVLGNILGKIQKILAPAERIFQILDDQPLIPPRSGSQQLGAFERLTFENVSFAYNSDKLILENIDLEIRAGEVIALVGTSGGGKTTLSDLIPRFIEPTAGRVLINGQDTRELTIDSLQDLIAIVSQETMLFDGTVRDNVALGRLGRCTPEEIDQAITDAQLDGWLTSTQDGQDSIVGERGNLISVGQKQRIAIARAYLKQAPLLILDEATSALDNETESKIQQALWKLMKGRTVIIIAHRLSTIKQADRIVVMEKGRIAEIGSHNALLAQGGIYKSLYNLQFNRDDSTEPQPV